MFPRSLSQIYSLPRHTTTTCWVTPSSRNAPISKQKSEPFCHHLIHWSTSSRLAHKRVKWNFCPNIFFLPCSPMLRSRLIPDYASNDVRCSTRLQCTFSKHSYAPEHSIFEAWVTVPPFDKTFTCCFLSRLISSLSVCHSAVTIPTITV